MAQVAEPARTVAVAGASPREAPAKVAGGDLHLTLLLCRPAACMERGGVFMYGGAEILRESFPCT